jgi:GNAT superfamily N-acetyltransferase
MKPVRQYAAPYKRSFFVALDSLKGSKVVIIHNIMIVGFMHCAHSSHRYVSLAQKLAFVPKMIFYLGWRPAFRVTRWLSIWSAHDLQNAHLDLEPIAVDPVRQGQGAGGKLMEYFCNLLDRAGLEGYLETDRIENVRFMNDIDLKLLKKLKC